MPLRGCIGLGCVTSILIAITLSIVIYGLVQQLVPPRPERHPEQSAGAALPAGTSAVGAAEPLEGDKSREAQMVLGALVGIGLSAACGYRVFAPPLAAVIAFRAGLVTVTPEWQHIFGSDLALVILAVAAIVEVAGYYIPWVDNALDTIALPAAMLAGTLLTASFITSMDPTLRWALAGIAGVTQAGVIQSTTAVMRGLSSVTTGGLANHLLATAEGVAAVVMSLLALLMPVIAVSLGLGMGIAGIFYFRGRLVRRLRRRRVAKAMAAKGGGPTASSTSV
jgi:hypothetical protein